MSRTISKFRFKQFSLSHHRSSMKVGVDGVLVGCWTNVEGAKRILDVGTGCGIIALIMAQRCPYAEITGIDIDTHSVEEATENVSSSLWANRIKMLCLDFPRELASMHNCKFDLIVSNPPYFDSGLTEIITSRERARHQGSLSPSSLLNASTDFLAPEGKLAMVVPSDLTSALEAEASYLGYSLMKKCFVRGHEGGPYKRSLLQWRFNTCFPGTACVDTEYLTLESTPNNPTDAYRALCKDFYLKF